MSLPAPSKKPRPPSKRDRSKASLLQKNYENLSHKFVADLVNVWSTHGEAALQEVATNRPELFLDAVAKLFIKLPQAIDATLSRKEVSKITNNTVVINESSGGAPPLSILEQLRAAKTPDADFEPVND